MKKTTNKLLLRTGALFVASAGLVALMAGTTVPAQAATNGISSITMTPDISGDGKPDVVAVDGAGQMILYAGDMSKKPYPFQSSYPVIGSGWEDYDVIAPGDFSGDGYNDLIGLQRSTGNLYLYPGNGKAQFTTKIQIGSGWSGLKVAASQLNGDKRPDLVAAFPSGVLNLYANAGGNAFAPSYPQVGADWQGYTLLPGGDLDRDGKGDIMSIAPDYTLYLYPGLGNGHFGDRKVVGTGWMGLRSVTSGVDFNQDGYPDIMAINPSGDLLLYSGCAAKVNYSFTGPTVIGSGWTAPVIPSAPSSLGQRIVAKAQATLNTSRLSNWPAEEWCAAYASYILQQSGSGAPYVTLADSFHKSSAYLTWINAGQTPQPGDLALWDADNNGVANHVNIVISVNSAYSFTIIGGNQGGGAGSVTQATVTNGTYGGMKLMGFARPIK